MDYVIIDGVSLYDTYGFILASKSIDAPTVQTHFVEVPLRDGEIDCTETLTGSVKYKNRTIEVTLKYVGDTLNLSSLYSKLANSLHGQKKRIIFSDDLGFYYIGRIAIDSWASDKYSGTMKLKCDCDPYKYQRFAADEAWEWDSFDFVDGVINEASSITVNGSTSFTLVCLHKKEYPTFTASAAMTMNFGSDSYSLVAGTNKFYDLDLEEGENTFTFIGSGTVSIDYKGGQL